MKRNIINLRIISLVLTIIAFGLVVSPILEMENPIFIGLLIGGIVLIIIDDIKNKKYEQIIPILIELIFISIFLICALLFIFK